MLSHEEGVWGSVASTSRKCTQLSSKGLWLHVPLPQPQQRLIIPRIFRRGDLTPQPPPVLIAKQSTHKSLKSFFNSISVARIERYCAFSTTPMNCGNLDTLERRSSRTFGGSLRSISKSMGPELALATSSILELLKLDKTYN